MDSHELNEWLLDSIHVDIFHPLDDSQAMLLKEDETCKVWGFDGSPYQFVFDKNRIEKAANEYNSLSFTRTVLHGGMFAERPFRPLASPFSIDAFLEAWRKVDDRNQGENIRFSIGFPSPAYVTAMFDFEAQGRSPPHFYAPLNLTCCQLSQNELDVFDVVGRTFGFLTLQVRSANKLEVTDLNSWLISLAFELSCQTQIALVPVDNLESPLFFDQEERASFLEDLAPPQRCYLEEPVYYFQAALANPIPSHRFLALYNVLEFFFEDHRRDAVVERLRELVESNQVAFDDFRAIVCTVDKHLTSATARDKLCSLLEATLTEQALEFLRKRLREPCIVRFSIDNAEIALDGPVREWVGTLSGKIVDTRNAIVHSKGYGRERYVPFYCGADLRSEVLLMHVIAELTIRERAVRPAG